MKLKALGFGLCVALLGFVTPAEAQPKNSLLNVGSVAITQVVLEQQGMDTSAKPENGKLTSSAWAVNEVVFKALGYRLGEYPSSVRSVEEALKAGQGVLINDRSKALAGDIVVASQDSHIGICMDDGCTKVISNLASKAQFGWLTTTDFDGLLKGKSTIYRVLDLRLLQF